MKLFVSLLFLLFCIVSCKDKTKQKVTTEEDLSNTVEWTALYNTSTVFNNYKKQYDTLRFTITRIYKEGKSTKDSGVQAFAKIDWSFWDKEMQQIDLYNKSFDHKYKMTQFARAEDSRLTTTLEAAETNLPVRKMIISTQLADNDLMMLFTEYNDNGITKKLMYSPYKTLQLIETAQGQTKITQLDFRPPQK